MNMRLYPRFVLAFVLVALFSIGITSYLDGLAARGQIKGNASPGAAAPPAAQRQPAPQPGAPDTGPPEDHLTPLLQGLDRSRLGAAAIALTASLALGSLLALGLVRPIGQLTQVNRRYMKGDRAARYLLNGRDELAELGQSFNHLADQLEAEQEQQKRLVADVAHDLRTPLTVLKGELEYFQDGLSEPTPAVIQRLSEEVDLLVRLVGDLRLLSLADAGSLSFNWTNLDLKALTGAAAQAFAHLAQAKGCCIVVEGQAATVRADRDRINQVLYNLLDNALQHTAAGTTIQCCVAGSEHGAELRVRDRGPGLPETELERIFERLHRTDSSRNRQDGGSGLGLAIVKTLAEAHGGTVTASNHPEGGAVFVLQLPGHAI